jgi:hypothetical protein
MKDSVKFDMDIYHYKEKQSFYPAANVMVLYNFL